MNKKICNVHRFGQMLLDGASIDGKRVLGPQTVTLMTADHALECLQ